MYDVYANECACGNLTESVVTDLCWACNNERARTASKQPCDHCGLEHHQNRAYLLGMVESSAPIGEAVILCVGCESKVWESGEMWARLYRPPVQREQVEAIG